MLLAFDTATPHVTVALHDGERVVATYSSAETMRHGEMLAPGIADVLRQAHAISRDITAVAVGVGPGPFTGLRVGLVSARTMGLALGIPVYGVCSLDVLAAEAIDGGVTGRFLVATDARRKEVYYASYDPSTGSGQRPSFRQAQGTATGSGQRPSFRQAQGTATGSGQRVAGPGVAKPADVATDALVVGRGAVLYPESFPTSAPPEHPSAAVLCDVVVGERFEILDPEPLYLRRPDAMESHRPKRVS